MNLEDLACLISESISRSWRSLGSMSSVFCGGKNLKMFIEIE